MSNKEIKDMTNAEIKDKVDDLKKEAGDLVNDKDGEKCEVYSRIVGYYRSVDNWNKGKAEEFKKRKTFDIK